VCRRKRKWARAKRKPFPGREEEGGGGEVFGRKEKPEQPNNLFISFLPTNALRLLKKNSPKK